MIISHKYKFLFVENPLTASWAIHQELCKYYDGMPILHKHANYYEFRSSAQPEHLEYYIFATVRNPLDKIVSRYFKIRNDQKGVFSNPNSVNDLVIDYSDLNKYRFVKDRNASFQEYFAKFYRLPYTDMLDLSKRYVNQVLRYENLQSDFFSVLSHLGILPVRQLPKINSTPEKPRSYLDLYTPDLIARAQWVCGPYMRSWKYKFPDEWSTHRLGLSSKIQYEFLNFLKIFYTTYFRYNKSAYAVLIRKLRSKFLL